MDILDLYCKETRIEININKSSILFNGLKEEEKKEKQISQIIIYTLASLVIGRVIDLQDFSILGQLDNKKGLHRGFLKTHRFTSFCTPYN